jgi:anti-anti-sigma factor
MEVDVPWAEAPGFYAEVSRNGSNSATMRLHGELDIVSAGAARRALEQVDAGIQQVALDLSHITFCDAAGVRFLLTAQEQARTAGRDLVVRHPSRSVRRVLALTGDLPAICPADPSPDEEPEPARAPARVRGRLAWGPGPGLPLTFPRLRRRESGLAWVVTVRPGTAHPG